MAQCNIHSSRPQLLTMIIDINFFIVLQKWTKRWFVLSRKDMVSLIALINIIELGVLRSMHKFAVHNSLNIS